MITIAVALGGMGLVCILSKRTLLGVLLGLQLMILGSTLAFVLAGVFTGLRTEGHLFGIFVALGGIAQLVVGYSLAIRMFYLKKRIGMETLRSLKH